MKEQRAPQWSATLDRLGSGRRGGFTLIELMVVLLLVAILTALILPEMRGTYEDALLRSSSRKLVEVFNLANSRAISTSQTQQVRFQPEQGRYQLESAAARGSVSEPPASEGAIDPRIRLELHNAPDSVTSDRGSSSGTSAGRPAAQLIRFYPDGTSDPGQIVLRDRAGGQLVLRLNPVTARIALHEKVSQ